jgi:hypothetical protein
MQNPAWRDVLTGEASEPGPVEPVPLTSPQQGMPPSAADLATETIQSQQVCRNCMVREVAIQDPLKPPANDRHGFVRIRQTNPGQPRAAFQLAGVSGASSETFLPLIPGRIASR